MENIIIGGIVGGMYALAIALYKSASKSLKFSDIQRIILFFLIIFPPLFFVIIIPFYIYNIIKYSQKKEIKQLKESVKQVNDLESAPDFRTGTPKTRIWIIFEFFGVLRLEVWFVL